MSLYNLRNPAVKRLMKEAEELLHPTEEYHAQPMEDNLFEWHFTLKGPPNTDYEGGIYHGRITLPPDYPMKPPSIILLTPNGRFETNKKICLSISGHHPESWQPSWSIRTALLAIIGFMPTHGNGAIGSLDYTPDERKMLALKSQEWKCHECGYIKDIFFQKKFNDLKDNACASPVSQVISKNLAENTLPCSKSNDNKSPEISVTEDIHSMHSTEETSSLVFRHKSTEVTSEDEPTQTITTATNITANNSSIFPLIGIWLIVFAIVVLLLRRLFSY